jgi:hypothetical protein
VPVRVQCLSIRHRFRAPSSGPNSGSEAVERDATKDNIFHDSRVVTQTMNTTRTTQIEPGFRIQLPPEWAEGLGLKGQVVLTRTVEGILVRPCPRADWDEIFATKLTIQPADPSDDPEITEVTGDDLLF